MTQNITINDKAAFQATLNTMTESNTSLADKLKDFSAITTAVTAAAGQGVVYGKPASNGTAVAAAYAETVGALDAAVNNIAKQAATASAAVTTAITELTGLLNGLTNIDDTAAGEINRT